MGGIFHISVLSLGALFNIAVLVRCLARQRWRQLGNIKFIIAAQAYFSAACIVSLLVVAVAVSVRNQSVVCWSVFPLLAVVHVSLAVYNLTSLTILKYYEVTDERGIRPSDVIASLMAVVGCTTLTLVPPLLHQIRVGIPVFRNDHCEAELLISEDDRSPFALRVYMSCFLVVQFVIPVGFIVNKLALLAVHLSWKEMSKQDSVRISGIHRFVINALTTAFVILTSLVILWECSSDAEAVDSLNKIFQKMELGVVIFLCMPIYLFDLIAQEAIAMNYPIP